MRSRSLITAVLCGLLVVPALRAQEDPATRLKGFDAYMEKVLKDWNAPGVAVGVVVGDKLVFAKGYGYRDVDGKLPMTPATVCQIASNTKLFTAVAAGMLVEDGKLTWDRPIRDAVPAIRFYNDDLDAHVTLRDMLSHRTGITRHDSIWYKSDFTRRELFDRIRFMEPKEPLRQTFLYNNMMYAAVGQILELQTGRTWEDLVQTRILDPLGMKGTGFSIAQLQKAPDHGVTFTEHRETRDLYRIPFYEDIVGVAPCGAIVSNVQDLSHWLAALMNDGKWQGRQVLPPAALAATLEPAIPLPNAQGLSRGWWEMQNAAYGMGRETVSYRGHLLTFHGGDLPGFHSQISYLPQERIGVIVLVIGDHCAPLYNTISYNIFERMLGLSLTPWNERRLDIYLKGKKAGTEARGKAGADRVPGTRPAHPLADYAGVYEHPAYGLLRVDMAGSLLQFNFHKIKLYLTPYHFERFDTPDDEEEGRFSLNFLTNPQGEVDKVSLSLDEAETVFTRRPEAVPPATLQKLAGSYETPTGGLFQVVLRDGVLYLAYPGSPDTRLIPTRGLRFKVPEFSDTVFEFVVEGEQVMALKQTDPSGEYSSKRK